MGLKLGFYDPMTTNDNLLQLSYFVKVQVPIRQGEK